ncbi:MAG: hypothetical protein ACREBJ_07390, partial [Nitrosotalea sp.]
MNTKVLILFSFTALLMFSQYALPNSFAADSSASDLNATSSTTPSVPVQSVSDSSTPSVVQSSDASSDSSTVPSVPVQPVSTPAIPSAPVVPTAPAPTQEFKGTMPSHSPQTASSDRFNSTSVQSQAHSHVPSVSPPS